MLAGLMQPSPLSIASLIEFADRFHGSTELVTRTVEGPIHRYTYHDAHRRAKMLANALAALGLHSGDRIGTLAWNVHRHFELYFAVSGMGAVLHTINPRLFAEQIVYIVNHAEDRWIFVDLTFVPLLERLAEHLQSVAGYVIMTDEASMPETSLPNARCYETLLAEQSAEYSWPVLDETCASSLCYTSGTTGNPKGVLYSHRSTVLHSFCVCAADGLAVSSREVILPVVPMFHANAWGVAYAAPMSGAKLVLPGAKMDGASIFELLHDERVTLTLGVPTVWLMLLDYCESSGQALSHLERVVIGGAAAPRSMIERFERDHDVEVIHAWGMTEMSPLGTVCNLLPKHATLDAEARLDLKVKQGRPVYGVDLKITDDENHELPRDGRAFGRLKVRGPWITNGYFRGEGGAVLDDEQWFDTGDVSTLDPDGFMQITDRSKDVIKSGGEWISSIDLENHAIGHPAVAEAAVIAVPHPKWSERPLLVVRTRENATVTREEILAWMAQKLAKWQVPDDVVFVDALPHTATGKIRKLELRQQFAEHQLPDED
ncbi:MAG: long-chain-fatty-acid--CoA ligase [Myxococcales bacterium]|nr:long-chain-fatty-acid--CoA ligase [Myxococcales bacterium]